MQNRLPKPRALRPPIPRFAPVPRKYRHDGWTPDRQRAFVEALADTGSVRHAAKRINMSSEGAYYLRRQPGAEQFAAAWDAALDHGVQNLRDIAFERAIDGVPVPVFWKGEQVGEKRRYNDRLLMFILKHHIPGIYNPPGRAAALVEPDDHDRDHDADESNWTEVARRLDNIRTHFKRGLAADPAKRAAWELLAGPTDWNDCASFPDYGEPNGPPTNMHRPDMIVTMACATEPGNDEG